MRDCWTTKPNSYVRNVFIPSGSVLNCHIARAPDNMYSSVVLPGVASC